MLVCPQCKLKYPNGSAHCFVDGTTLEVLTDARVGTTIAGRYVLEDVLGEGGMATVYRARHRLVDRRCAVKVMNPAFAKDEVICERFRREARAAQKLAHANIIEIFDQGELPEGGVYLVMELLKGETLAELMDRGKVPLDRTLSIALQVTRALARAHDLEVIHRDLKPENIFLAADDANQDLVKLLDFGIARSMRDSRLTGMGEVFGTPQYMAPERISSIDAGPSADLYAVGVILFEMLAGQLPWQADNVPEWFVKHMQEVPPDVRTVDPGVPEQLATLIADLMAKQPEARPVDAHRVYQDLMTVAGALGVRTPADDAASVESKVTPARTLPPVALDAWVRRTAVFEQMLQTAYGGAPPQELNGLLREVKVLVSEIGSLRARALDDQRALQTIEQRGRENRQRLNHAVDALGIDASRAKDQLRNALAAQATLAAQSDIARSRLQRAHKDILLWEGRSGFHQPYRQLAEAYRQAAEAVDAWQGVADQKLQTDQRVARERDSIRDLEFQIEQLRRALVSNEEQTEEEARSRQDAVAHAGQQADEKENRLLALATRFCAPLRNMPQLRALFRELEADVAA